MNLSGCGDNQEVTVSWSNVPPGAHEIYVQVTPDAGVIETKSDNNLASGVILVASHQIFMPTVSRSIPVLN